SNVAALAGILVGVALATIDYRVPIIAAGFAITVFGIVLYFLMPEEGFRPRDREPGRPATSGLVTTYKDGVRQVRAHHVLVLILGTAALHGASTEGFDRLAHLPPPHDVGAPAGGG